MTVPYRPQIVMITGATGDFGRAFVARYAALGCKLVLHGRDPEKLDALVTSLPAGRAYPLLFDMRDKAAMQAALNEIHGGFSDVDLLINNAGLALGLDKAQDADPDDWETMIDVDVKALSLLTNHILRGMVLRKKGHIVNIGSTAGSYPYAGGNVYCAAKAFVKQFSLALRADLAGTNIRVTNIEPGQVETQFSTVRFKGDSERATAVYAGTNSLQAADIAEAVLWATTLPPHVNINRLEMMPTTQSFAGLKVERV